MPKFEIVHYCENGHDIFEEWLKSLKDKRAAVAIARRLQRLGSWIQSVLLYRRPNDSLVVVCR